MKNKMECYELRVQLIYNYIWVYDKIIYQTILVYLTQIDSWMVKLFNVKLVEISCCYESTIFNKVLIKLANCFDEISHYNTTLLEQDLFYRLVPLFP